MKISIGESLMVPQAATRAKREFDLLLREVVLLGLFAASMLCLSFVLSNHWRRKKRSGGTGTGTLAVVHALPSRLPHTAPPALDELGVDVLSLSFHVTVISLALSLTTAVALPLTFVFVTRVRVCQNRCDAVFAVRASAVRRARL